MKKPRTSPAGAFSCPTNAGQLEALLDFIRENAAAPVLGAPHLLAVLFCPVDAAEQSADVVSAAAEAFARL